MKIWMNLWGLLISILFMPIILMVFIISLFVFTIEETIKQINKEQ